MPSVLGRPAAAASTHRGLGAVPKAPRHRAGVAQVAGEARVSTPVMPGTPWRVEERRRATPRRASSTRDGAEVAHDDAASRTAGGLVVVGVHAVVADVRVGEGDDLAGVATGR